MKRGVQQGTGWVYDGKEQAGAGAKATGVQQGTGWVFDGKEQAGAGAKATGVQQGTGLIFIENLKNSIRNK